MGDQHQKPCLVLPARRWSWYHGQLTENLLMARTRLKVDIMESVEVSVRLDPTTDQDAKEAYEQLILTFSHYGLSPDAQDAVWRSAVRFTTHLLLKHGEIPSLEGADEDTPLRYEFPPRPK